MVKIGEFRRINDILKKYPEVFHWTSRRLCSKPVMEIIILYSIILSKRSTALTLKAQSTTYKKTIVEATKVTTSTTVNAVTVG